MNNLKGALTGFITTIYIGLTTYFGAFTPLLILTVIAMFCDLLTRMYAAGSSHNPNEHLESKKVMTGLYRKLGMCLLICLTLIMDAGLSLIVETLGINLGSKILFTAFTLAWIFIRELISNLENLKLAGIELPTFVTRALDLAKDKIDNEADNQLGGTNNEDKN